MYKQVSSVLSLLAVIFAGIILFAGCDNATGNATATPEAHRQEYFNVRNFIDSEAVQLAKANPLVEKVAYLNGKEEHREVHFDKKQWQTELAPFLDADITKTAFIKRYQVDTIKTNDTVCIAYTALDDKLRTRELKMYFDKQTKPFKMEAFLKADKVFYHSGQHITFTESQGYEVRGRQEILLFGTDTFAVKARLEKAL